MSGKSNDFLIKNDRMQEMGKEGYIEIGIGEEAYTSNGAVVSVEYEDLAYEKLDGIEPSDEAEHEAGHAGVAELTGTSTVKIDLDPSIPGVEAVTEVSGFNKYATAASLHRRGARSDRLKLIMLGEDPESAGSVARSIENGASDQFRELAIVAEAERIIYGPRIRQAMRDGRDGRPVVVTSKDQLGNTQRIETRSKGAVRIVDMKPNIVYSLSPMNQPQPLQLAA